MENKIIKYIFISFKTKTAWGITEDGTFVTLPISNDDTLNPNNFQKVNNKDINNPIVKTIKEYLVEKLVSELNGEENGI